MPIRQSSRRERQRISLSITAEELAGELGITVEQLTVLEARADEDARENAGRAWDEALGRIVRARADATRDAAAEAAEERQITRALVVHQPDESGGGASRRVSAALD